MLTRNFLTIGREDLPDPDGLVFRTLKLKGTQRRTLFNNVEEMIGYAGICWKFRPLPRRVRAEYINTYISALNGFEGTAKRPCTIDGRLVASDYTRVVMGDYGAYVEFPEEALLIRPAMKLKEGQEWRNDPEYLKKREITKRVKYVWYVWQRGNDPNRELKVYRQLNPVKYADYKPGFYYISVLEFDLFTEDSRGI